jgi:hypothetical protein
VRKEGKAETKEGGWSFLMNEKKKSTGRLLIGLLSILFSVDALFVPFGTVRAAERPGTAAEDDREELRGLAVLKEIWTGDFDQMLERRMIRVLVP